MRLFHITNVQHFKTIYHEDRFLKVTESNIGSPEFLKPDPDDPDYDEPTVLVWEKKRRFGVEKRSPMLVPGQVLKKMEEGCERYIRCSSDDPEFVGMKDTDNIGIIVVKDFEPDLKATKVKFGNHVADDVVWLTKDPTPTQTWAHVEKIPDKAVGWHKDEILFVVDIPDHEAHHWPEWSREQGITEVWYDALNDHDNDAENWFVVLRKIPDTEWVAIYHVKSGRPVWLNPDLHEVPKEWLTSAGLIKIQSSLEASERYPAPQVYKAAKLRSTT